MLQFLRIGLFSQYFIQWQHCVFRKIETFFYTSCQKSSKNVTFQCNFSSTLTCTSFFALNTTLAPEKKPSLFLLQWSFSAKDLPQCHCCFLIPVVTIGITATWQPITARAKPMTCKAAATVTLQPTSDSAETLPLDTMFTSPERHERRKTGKKAILNPDWKRRFNWH